MCVRWNTRSICLSFHQYCNISTGSTEIQDDDSFCVVNNNTISAQLSTSTAPDTSLHSSQIPLISRTPIAFFTCHALCHLCSFYCLSLLLTFAPSYDPPPATRLLLDTPWMTSAHSLLCSMPPLKACLGIPSRYTTPIDCPRVPSHSRLYWLVTHLEWAPIIQCCVSPIALSRHRD